MKSKPRTHGWLVFWVLFLVAAGNLGWVGFWWAGGIYSDFPYWNFGGMVICIFLGWQWHRQYSAEVRLRKKAENDLRRIDYFIRNMGPMTYEEICNLLEEELED